AQAASAYGAGRRLTGQRFVDAPQARGAEGRRRRRGGEKGSERRGSLRHDGLDRIGSGVTPALRASVMSIIESNSLARRRLPRASAIASVKAPCVVSHTVSSGTTLPSAMRPRASRKFFSAYASS